MANGDTRLIVSTDFGPRILHYSLDGGENILGWHPDLKVETALGTWKPYGGHRLWLAPECMPLSYVPDDDAVEYEIDGERSVRLFQKNDPNSKTQRSMTVSLAAAGSKVFIGHSITNTGETEIELATWAITIMAPGGTVIVPNEPLASYDADSLRPVRTISLWPYTDLSDPRLMFETGSIRLRVDASVCTPLKFGVLNKQGWAAYVWKNVRFLKTFKFLDGPKYPDMNSNNEIYTDGSFIEIETLSPLTNLLPGETVGHSEQWELLERPSAE